MSGNAGTGWRAGILTPDGGSSKSVPRTTRPTRFGTTGWTDSLLTRPQWVF
jgi:hypothetical protein